MGVPGHLLRLLPAMHLPVYVVAYHLEVPPLVCSELDFGREAGRGAPATALRWCLYGWLGGHPSLQLSRAPSPVWLHHVECTTMGLLTCVTSFSSPVEAACAWYQSQSVRGRKDLFPSLLPLRSVQLAFVLAPSIMPRPVVPALILYCCGVPVAPSYDVLLPRAAGKCGQDRRHLSPTHIQHGRNVHTARLHT